MEATQSETPTTNGKAPEVFVSTIKTPEIYQRMVLAVRDIAAVPKTRKNDFHGYHFRGIDDMLNAVHPILAKHGLFLTPNIEGEPKVVERASTKGKAELHIVCKVRWTVYAQDGSNVSASTLGEASDTGDKGCNKAMSASQKYALIQLFSIPTEGDHDTENRSPEFAAGKPTDFKSKATTVDEYMGQGGKPALPPAKVTADDLLAGLGAVTNPDKLEVWRVAAKKEMAALKKADPAGYDAVVAKGKELAESFKNGPAIVCDACHASNGHTPGCPEGDAS